MSWICPGCKTSNRDESNRCICGYELEAPVVAASSSMKSNGGTKATTAFGVFVCIILLGIFAFCFIRVDVSPQNVKDRVKSSTAPQSSPFNNSEKLFVLNGNLAPAIKLIRRISPEMSWQKAQDTPLANISRDPYSSIGTLYRITGTTQTIRKSAPSDGLPGQWYEILILSENPNSVIGFTSVEILYNGNADDIVPQTSLTASGLFIGTYESKNMLGGNIEGLFFVSNAVSVSPEESAPPER